MREVGCGRRCERLSVKEEGRVGELVSDLDLDPYPDSDPWKLLVDPDPANDPDLSAILLKRQGGPLQKLGMESDSTLYYCRSFWI